MKQTGGEDMKSRKKNPYSYVTSVYLCLLILYLLWFDDFGLTKITAAKRNAFYVLCAVYFASVLLIFLYRLLSKKSRFSDLAAFFRQTSWTQRLIGLYLLFTVISSLLSPYRSSVLLGAGRMEGLLTILCYGIGFLLISSFAQTKRWMLWLFASVTVIFCLLGFLQRMNFNPLFLYPSYDTPAVYSQTFLSTVGNVDHVAAFLCIAIPVFWVSMLRAEGNRRLLLLIPLICSLVLLILIHVAAGIVGIVLGTALSLPVVIPAGKKTKRILASVLLLLLLLCILALFFFDFSNKTLHQFHMVLHGQLKNSYGSGRIRIWKRVLKFIPGRLWFGYGPDTMALTPIAQLDFKNAEQVVVKSEIIDAAHNEYLNILFHQGIFALLSYLGALGTALLRWVRHAKCNPTAAVLGAAVLTYCIQAFFGISQLICAPFFWCALALLDNSFRQKNRPFRIVSWR